jgi:hypothetical protein
MIVGAPLHLIPGNGPSRRRSGEGQLRLYRTRSRHERFGTQTRPSRAARDGLLRAMSGPGSTSPIAPTARRPVPVQSSRRSRHAVHERAGEQRPLSAWPRFRRHRPPLPGAALRPAVSPAPAATAASCPSPTRWSPRQPCEGLFWASLAPTTTPQADLIAGGPNTSRPPVLSSAI